MKALIELFWFKYAQLQQAARAGDDLLMEILGQEIDPVLLAIYEEVASNVAEARLQFQFVLDLLQKEADDLSSVLRQRGALETLADRYFGEAGYSSTKADPIGIPSIRKARMDEGFLNEAILDCMPDRIAVITRDYRYLYTNPINAARLDERPMDLVGRHVVEFVGLQRFEKRVKPNLDRCFSGEPVDYTFAKDADGRTVVVRCRMTPCRSSTGKIIGAILILQEIADRRRSIAA
ncbi:PAS domain S-box-containing protein [Pararhizobium capsulatum DSM 1112]|uniref:PAS domain S-box-containing protein n=1 Tax=Pararhizobium capsulatum DSM 1112 TaxID=1121113 RepID=A0ABU0BSM0_9HYPH|nr:PAS domain-containing protein [Pararhizobium capsulatum]MDQ0320664.1 PAS domain S-box-containing protein [Pararhizobium capsulatum DSM 1112]